MRTILFTIQISILLIMVACLALLGYSPIGRNMLMAVELALENI